MIDAVVFIGLAAIIVTGLVISTWLDLALANYSTLKTIHVIASIGTQAAVVIKLGLHWRWIIITSRRYIFMPDAAARQQRPVPAATGMGRREFLRLMGDVSVFAAIAAGSAVDALAQTASTTTTATSSTPSKTTSQSAAAASTQAQSASSCTVRCPKGCSYRSPF